MAISVRCPLCGREVRVDERTLAAASEAAGREGRFTLSVDHGDHVVEVVLGPGGELLGVSARRASGGSLFSMLELRPIPRESTPPPSVLSRDELHVWIYVDGRRTLGEIARLTGLPRGRVKALLEELKNKGFIGEIREVVA